MVQRNLPAPIEHPKFDTPEMRALSTMQQRFVIALQENRGMPAAHCLRAAGWEGTDGGCKLTSHRWIHLPKVKAAIQAMIPGRMLEHTGTVFNAALEIINDPQHKDRARMIVSFMAWMAPPRTEQAIEVTHKFQSDEVMRAEANSLLQANPELKTLVARLFGKPKVIEAEFTVIPPELADLEDVL